MSPSRTVGVLSPLVSGPYFGALLTGVTAEASAAGWRSMVIQTLDPEVGDSHPGIPEVRSRLAWRRMDAVIVITGAAPDAYLTELRDSGVPMVLISHTVPGLDVPRVGPDNRAGVRAAVEHLVGHGHTRIAFAGHPQQTDLRQRYASYRETLLAHGLEAGDELFLDTGDSMETGGRVAADLLLAAHEPPTAVVAGNDLNAAGLMTALQAAGRRIPQDVAVVGFDDAPSSEHRRPALASINQNVTEIGAFAVRLLLRSVAGEQVPTGLHLVPGTLATRESCGCLGAQVPEVPVADVDVREWLIDRFSEAVLAPGTGVDTSGALTGAARDLADMVLAAAEGAPVPGLAGAAEALFLRHPRGQTVSDVVAAVQQVTERLIAAQPDPRAARERLATCLRRLSLALGDARVRGQAGTTLHLQDSLRHEFNISMDLLRGQEHDPASLRWLRHSPVRAGALALWTTGSVDDADLRIMSTFGDAIGDSVGTVLRPHDFPPAELVEVVDRHPGTQLVVLPVKTAERDWGLLAVVGVPESRTATGRETYFQWAAMLSVALDIEEMVDSLWAQREDLAEAYRRERALTETIRSSEERYALAASAANDGLWDWDLVTDVVYYSPRWRSMFGYDDAGVGDEPREWLDRVHPDDLATLTTAIDQCRAGTSTGFEHEHRLRAQDGSHRWALCRALAVPGDGAPATRLVGSITDVTDRRVLEDQLRLQALFDTLTGLPNRALFLDRLDQAIARTARRPDERFAVLFLDLDGFKVVNDSLGHSVGDGLLRQVAERLRTGLRSTDTAARLGGDEFTVLLEDVADLELIGDLAAAVQARLAEPYDVEGTSLVVTASAGVTTSEFGYTRAQDVLRDADIAMYRAKSRERGTAMLFEPSMHQSAMSRLRTESELRRALERDELVLRYQPIVDLTSGGLTGLEALIRWNHPSGREVPPIEFLPVAEETGLIVPFGRWVVERVCAQLVEWRTDERCGLAPVSLNVSHREFWDAGLLDHLAASLARYEVDPTCLTVEITEGVLMADVEEARIKLQALHEAGIRLHVDDFGTGYSSLEALHRFPIDALKIDRSFVSRLDSDARSRELVGTIVLMARGLDIDVIAEGVETVTQQQTLRDLGCRLGQGYLFARPMLPDDVTAMLRATVADP